MIYTLLWIGWLIVLGGSFAVVEAFALRNDMPGDTLSAHIRKWFSVHTKIGRTIFLGVWQPSPKRRRRMSASMVTRSAVTISTSN